MKSKGRITLRNKSKFNVLLPDNKNFNYKNEIEDGEE